MARSFLIGLDPTGLDDVRGYLEAAAARSPEPLSILDGELLWTVRRFDGAPVPVAVAVGAATTRVTVDGVAEVILVGGRGLDWIEPLEAKLVSWARDEGAHTMRAFGRAGWRKVLNWTVAGTRDGITIYERGV